MRRNAVYRSTPKCFVLLLVLAALLLALLPTSVVTADSVVTFPDPNLEAAIRDAIREFGGDPSGDIHESDLQFPVLGATDRGIVDLTGLEHCDITGLLDLSHNQISNLSPLSNIIVDNLYLDSNQISDIGPLVNSGLGPDSGVTLRDNPLSSTSINTYIPALQAKGVFVAWNEEAPTVVTFPDPNLRAAIRDAIGKPTGDIFKSDLDGLTSLERNASGIVDLTGLEHCTGLKTLNLTNNQITDISPLSGLTSLTHLRLYGNRISDISPLSGLTILMFLEIQQNRISDISPLSGLTKLDLLSLGKNQISDISPLSSLTNLERYLSLSENRIGDVSPLSGLTRLRSLDLGANQISDISPLSRLVNLSQLVLYGNRIGSLLPIAGLTGLRDVILSGNQISDVSPLSSLNSLGNLQLSGNQISDISPLSGLTSLWGLGLSSNQISDISPLSGLTSLTMLELRYNQIGDIEPLVDNSGIGSEDSVDLRNNPLNSTSIDIWIPALVARGVDVTWDPPTSSLATATNPATAVTQTSATLNGSLISLGSASSVQVSFEWGPTTAYGYTTTPGAVTATGALSATISGLTPGTTYHFRAKAAAGDATALGDDSLFTAGLSDTSPPTVNDFKAEKADVSVGENIRLSYSVSDTGGSGLKQVELWQGTDIDGDGQPNWPDSSTGYVEMRSLSGQDATGNFDVTLTSAGTFWYGIHVVDNAGNMNDEANSHTGGLPSVFGPVSITVGGVAGTVDLEVRSLEFLGAPEPFEPDVLTIFAVIRNNGPVSVEHAIVNITLNGTPLSDCPFEIGPIYLGEQMPVRYTWRIGYALEVAKIEVSVQPAVELDSYPDNNGKSKKDVSFHAIPFQHDEDAFKFENWQYPSWDEWWAEFRAFLVDKAIRDDQITIIGSLVVAPLFRHWDKYQLGGRCYGMASSSAAYYVWESTRPVPEPTFSMDKSEAQSDIIERHFEQVLHLWPLSSNIAQVFQRYSAKDEYDVILEQVRDLQRPVIVTVRAEGAIGAHAVLAYKVLDLGESEKRVFVYDNNRPYDSLSDTYPLDPTKRKTDDYYITFNLRDNTVSYLSWNRAFATTVQQTMGKEEILAALASISSEYIGSLKSQVKKTLRFHSPVEPLVTDESGRMIGYLNGEFVNTIPGAEMEDQLESKLFTLPADLSYTVNAVGTGTGLVGIDLMVPTSMTTVRVAIFRDIPIESGSSINFSLNTGELPTEVSSDAGETFKPTSSGEIDSSTLSGVDSGDTDKPRVHLWVYLVAAVGGLVGLGVLATLGVWLKRRLAK